MPHLFDVYFILKTTYSHTMYSKKNTVYTTHVSTYWDKHIKSSTFQYQLVCALIDGKLAFLVYKSWVTGV